VNEEVLAHCGLVRPPPPPKQTAFTPSTVEFFLSWGRKWFAGHVFVTILQNEFSVISLDMAHNMNSVPRYFNSITSFQGMLFFFHKVTRINMTLFTVQCYIQLYYVLVCMCLLLLMLFAYYKLFPLYSHTPRSYATRRNFSLIRGVLLQIDRSHIITTDKNPKQDLSFLIMVYRYIPPPFTALSYPLFYLSVKWTFLSPFSYISLTSRRLSKYHSKHAVRRTTTTKNSSYVA